MKKVNYRSTKPWTWKEISELRDNELNRFLKAYGDRGKAATRAAGLKDVCCGVYGNHQWTCTSCPMNVPTPADTESPCHYLACRAYDKLCANGNVYPEVMP